MKLRRVAVDEAAGHILVHNVVGPDGRKVLAKGRQVDEAALARLRALSLDRVDVAILDGDDVGEDAAAERIGAALVDGAAGIGRTRGIGGRVNLHAERAGVLHVQVERLARLNGCPGVTLATREPFAVAGGVAGPKQLATLKIIPYALPERVVARAARAAAGLLHLAPLRPQRVALLVTAEPAAAERVTRGFEGPTRVRLERLGCTLPVVQSVPAEEAAIQGAAVRLLAEHDALIVAGQTSVMDREDTTPRALTAAGAEVALHGAPVEPGNLLALAYLGPQWILCAPGCARSPGRNIVDLVLPRLIAGERLGPAQIAALGPGGLIGVTD